MGEALVLDDIELSDGIKPEYAEFVEPEAAAEAGIVGVVMDVAAAVEVAVVATVVVPTDVIGGRLEDVAMLATTLAKSMYNRPPATKF